MPSRGSPGRAGYHPISHQGHCRDGDTIGEAFVRGPSYYYWSVRVATADRIRCEVVTQARIKEIKEKATACAERY